MSGTKLTIHAQSKAGNFDRFMSEARPYYVKLMDWGTDWPYSESRVILRMFEDDKITSERAGRGVAGARETFEKWAPEWSKRAHYAWAIEDVANEPHPMHDSNFNIYLDEYTCEMSRLFKTEGWIYAGNLFSVGWPDVGRAGEFAYSMSELAKNGHIWAPHEYGNPTMLTVGTDGKPYWCGRCAMTIKELRQAAATVPSIYIGECGLDYGVSTPSATVVEATKGWQYVSTDHDAYFNQLINYDDGLASIENQLHVPVLTACVYNSGGYSPWETFEINDPLMDLLINRWQTYRGERAEIGQAPVEEHVSKPPPQPPAEPEPEPVPEPSPDPATDPNHLEMAIGHTKEAIAFAQAALTHLISYQGKE